MSSGIDTQFSVLQKYSGDVARNQAINQIATEFNYVAADTIIEELANDLNKDDSIRAVGVVDEQRRVKGVIARNELFSLLGRPYGRDVLSRLPVSEVGMKAPRIRFDANIFTAADELDEYLRASEVSYFCLTDDSDRFHGIFSTHDLLLYLSEMTQRDIALARKLQSRIVHERDLVVGKTFEFTSYSQSAKGVGGDFYRIAQTDDEDWVMTVCDVSGKGVSASILTSVMWGMMSIYDFRRGMGPFIREVNSYVMDTFESEKFVTGVFISYNERTGVLQLCDMGHSHIFVFRNGKLQRLNTHNSNMPIGVVADVDPVLNRFVPRENDILLVVTDGLLEQESESQEIFSLERVSSILSTHHEKPVESINDRIISEFEEFRGNHHLNDDVTYIMVKFREQDVRL